MATCDFTVVGGGLVGCLLAAELVKFGTVELFEKLSDWRSAAGSGGRSINLVLTERGVLALRKAGVAEDVLKICVPVYGRMIHMVDGEIVYQPYGKDRSECNFSVSRLELNKLLLQTCENAGVKIFFDHKFAGLDLKTGIISFETPSGARVTRRCKTLFGVDGGGSGVRYALRDAKQLNFTEDLLSHGYKELTFLPPHPSIPKMDMNALHIWPRGDHMLMALANPDGSFTGTMYLPKEGTMDYSFPSTSTAGGAAAVFEKYYKTSIPNLGGTSVFSPALAAAPVGLLGTVRTDNWCYSDDRLGFRVALVGDAAHAITPFFGQGCNCGFEDVSYLIALMGQYKNWDVVLSKYFAYRKPAADAIAAMALENFREMRESTGDKTFLKKKEIESELEKRFPNKYRSRYALIMYSFNAYNHCQIIGNAQRVVVEELYKSLPSPTAPASQLDFKFAERLIDEHITPLFGALGASLDFKHSALSAKL